MIWKILEKLFQKYFLSAGTTAALIDVSTLNVYTPLLDLNKPSMSIETDIKQKKFRSPYQRLALNLVYTTNWLEYKQHEFFKEHDISAQQYNVLRILRGQQNNPIKVSDITGQKSSKTYLLS
jgi:hypothetical protein